MTHAEYMRRALELALKGRGKTSPNPMVGSVIVKGNRIIAEGWHARCGGDHAEVVALKKAGGRSRGSRMYVTLEPCHHYGRTPPCVDQIIQKGIKEVYVGMRDPNPLTNGKSIAKLRRHWVKTRVGILRNELEEINEAFVKYVKKGLPLVAAKCAQTLDGKIATAAGHSKWITSAAARRFARKIRAEYDAIMVGVDTVLADNPRLSAGGGKRAIQKIVLDSSLRTPLSARLFSGGRRSDCTIATTARAPKTKRSAFIKKGINILMCPQRRGQIDLKWLLRELAKRGVTSVLMEGGAHVIGSALREKLVDKMYIYLAPKIMGDQKALSSIVGLKPARIGQAARLQNIKVKEIDGDILVTGHV